MPSDKEILANLREYLTAPEAGKDFTLPDLPDEFELEDVPYYIADKKHWSGAACAQMILAYHGRAIPEQAEIASEMGIEDWQYMNHESLEEDMVRYVTKKNLIPSIYFPALRLSALFPDDAEKMGDFMYRNMEEIMPQDWEFFKATLVQDKAPVFIRIHFTTEYYPMSEEMAQILDNVGHGVLIVGYNKEGFIIHDPWNKDKWGGTKGGARTLLQYDEMLGPGHAVNSTYDFMASFSPLKVQFRMPYQIPFPNKDIEIGAYIKAPGIHGIHGECFTLTGVEGFIRAQRNLELRTVDSSMKSAFLTPGMREELRWSLNTGSVIGSVPLSAKVQATVHIPRRPWERNNRKDESVTVHSTASTRIDVKNPDWFHLYGRL